MNIQIESLFSNQNGIEFTWSNNGGEESEIEKMSKEDFAKLLCAESDGEYRCYDEVVCFDSYISEDETMVNNMSITTFFEFSLDRELDYCKECLVKHIQSLVKNYGMGEMYKRYKRRQFSDWKRKVRERIPKLVSDFYSVSYRPYEQHVELGKVIHWINNPYYSHIDNQGNHTDEIGETSSQIVLEILVCSIFKTVYSKI